MTQLNEEYWTNRYSNATDKWDIGFVSTPIKEYVDQLEYKDIRILIPGAGNSYEAEYLFKQGFKNIFVCDLSEIPLRNLQNRVPEFSSFNLIHGNFFDLDSSFDLIIEQTFFCALNPSLRKMYVDKTQQLLQPNGKLVGLFFGQKFDKIGPPFGGNEKEYRNLFQDAFTINVMATCYNSIEARKGKELFINFTAI